MIFMFILLTILSSSAFCLTPSLKNLGASRRRCRWGRSWNPWWNCHCNLNNDEKRSHQKQQKVFRCDLLLLWSLLYSYYLKVSLNSQQCLYGCWVCCDMLVSDTVAPFILVAHLTKQSILVSLHTWHTTIMIPPIPNPAPHPPAIHLLAF